jgi:hypothetical protein
MHRSVMTLALAALSTAIAVAPAMAQGKAKAPTGDPACKQARWDMKGAGSKTIADGNVDRVWRVSIGGVPANAIAILEYTRSNGTKGEVGMPSGYATLVEGASVRMVLQTQGFGGNLVVAGKINAQCGKAR